MIQRKKNRSESDDEYDVWLDPRSQYDWLMKRLCEGYSRLVIWDRGVLEIIFANIDEFCKEVCDAEGITSVDFGHVQGDHVEGPKLKITKENASSWNKIFHTISNISSIEVVVGGGYT